MSQFGDEWDEKTLNFLESQIPSLSASAVNLAFFKALESGNSVLETVGDGKIYEIFPDGSKKFFKETPAYVPTQIGKKIMLK
jgi:hypothetical protein